MTTSTTLGQGQLASQEIKDIGDIEAMEAVPLAERDIPSNTYELICRTAQRTPHNVAIRYIENIKKWKAAKDKGSTNLSREITYAEFVENINQTANLFRSLGVSDSDVVSMVLPNVPEAHFTLWGGEAAGVVNPINHMLEGEVIGEIVASANSKVVVVMGEHTEIDIAQKLSEIRAKAPCIEHVLVVGQLPSTDSDWTSFEEQLQSQRCNALDFKRKISRHSIASLFHTGGTTGLPKLAQHSHGNETYTAWALNCLINASSDDCYLTGLPVFHCNAAIATGLTVFFAGGTVLLAGINGYRSPGVMANIFPMIEHYRVTSFSGVPTIYSVLAQQPVGDFDLSSVRFAICGAAPMPRELYRAFRQRTGIQIVEGYGLTEATVCSTMTPPAADTPRIGSIGIRIPYTQIKVAVIDEEGVWIRECDFDEVGNLVINAPSVTPGYTDTSKNSELFVTDADGQKWLNTGDLARQDSDGYLWMTGRSKELIIRGGHNIDPKTIEEALTAHPAVNMAAAIGRPDAYAGEVPVAYVDTVAETTEHELLEYCKQNIGERAAVPKAIVMVDQLPVTGVGKIHKPTLHLMEINKVVTIELDQFAEQLADLAVDTEADKKLGNVAKIRLELAHSGDASTVESAVRKILDGYSFAYEIRIV